jgi:hypothetical protein
MDQLHQKILTAWTSAGEKITDQQTKALFGGVNIRINVRAAFKAVYESAILYFELHAAPVAAAADPGFVLKVGKDVYDIVRATLDALVEKMTALEYTACVVLSRYEDGAGVTPEAFEKDLRALLALGTGDEIPWYCGLTRHRLREAKGQLGDFSQLMDQLRKNDWLTNRSDGTFAFKPRHYVWSAKVD